MPAGRCAGCGETNASSKKINQHVTTCTQFIELYKTSPERALTPEKEWERWNNEENTDDARAEAKDIRLTKRFMEMDVRREKQKTRWTTPKDILSDD